MIDEISIVIPTLNEASYLPKLLDSIVEQAFKGKLEVIVVDGHSTDKTRELAGSFRDRIPDLVLVESGRNPGFQRNKGADLAKYKYLLFIDADVVLPHGMLEKLIQKVRFHGPFIIGVMHTAQNMNLADRLFQLSAYPFVFQSRLMRLPVTFGDFILTTRENHRNIHGFVEGALLGEDVDYGFRSVKAGADHKFYLKPAVIGSYRRARKGGRWRLLMLWARGYRHVLKRGPVFPGEGYEYPYGSHDESK